MVKLSDRDWFARGGNRLCYVHPDHADQCLKVARHRADATYAPSRRRGKPLDENLSEAHAYGRFSAAMRAELLLPRYFGMVETDLGPALACSLFRDADGRISRTLEHALWTEGMTDPLDTALKHFQEAWSRHGFATRKILPHNLVVVRSAGSTWQLAPIDGFTVSWWGRLTLPLSHSAAANARALGAAAMEILSAKNGGHADLAKSIDNRVRRWHEKNP